MNDMIKSIHSDFLRPKSYTPCMINMEEMKICYMSKCYNHDICEIYKGGDAIDCRKRIIKIIIEPGSQNKKDQEKTIINL